MVGPVLVHSKCENGIHMVSQNGSRVANAGNEGYHRGLVGDCRGVHRSYLVGSWGLIGGLIEGFLEVGRCITGFLGLPSYYNNDPFLPLSGIL